MVSLKELLQQTLEIVKDKSNEEEMQSNNDLCRELIEYLKMWNEKSEECPQNAADYGSQENLFYLKNCEELNTETLKDGANFKPKYISKAHKTGEIRVRERLQRLSEPKQVEHISDLNQELLSIPKAALRYRASHRIRTLAKPVNREVNKVCRENAFQVKRAALRAQCTPRILELAKPARSNDPPIFIQPPELKIHTKRVKVTGLKPQKN